VHFCRKSMLGLLSLMAKVSASRLLQSTLRRVDVRLLRVCGSCCFSVNALACGPLAVRQYGSKAAAHLDNYTVPSRNGCADGREY
jgi:hypothetical protein